MAELPGISAKVNKIDLPGPKTYHIEGWGGMGDQRRLKVIREVAMRRGRDPRIATLALTIIRDAGVKPRDYVGQAAALLKWVQNPKNCYYINEPGERLQDPLYTLKVKYGDCDDMALLLCALFESVKLEWKLVISGRNRVTKQKVRHVEGEYYPANVQWAHIYCMVGDRPFTPKRWFFCEPTLNGAPLGWDVVAGSAKDLPEMEGLAGIGFGEMVTQTTDSGQQAQAAVVVAPPPPPAPPPQAPPKPMVAAPAPKYPGAEYTYQYEQEQQRRQRAGLPQSFSLSGPYGAASGIATGAGAAVAAAVDESGTIKWKNIGVSVLTGVITAVVSQTLLDIIREKRRQKIQAARAL